MKLNKTVHFFINPKRKIPNPKTQDQRISPFGTWNLRFGIWDLINARFYHISCIVLGLGLFYVHIYGQVIIEKSENFKNENLKANKIIFISPELSIYTVKMEAREEFIEETKLHSDFVDYIRKSCRKNHLPEAEIIDNLKLEKENIDYYNYLIQLKEHILKVNSIQNNPFSKNMLETSKSLTQSVFVIPMKLFPEFSFLSKKYGTPYFAIYGWLSIDASKRSKLCDDEILEGVYGRYSYLYFILVNVENADVIYREVKKINFVVKDNRLFPVIFDTFHYFNNNLSNK